jgi:hypothetical protein
MGRHPEDPAGAQGFTEEKIVPGPKTKIPATFEVAGIF